MGVAINCPRCGQIILFDDSQCKYCGYVTEYGEKIQKKKKLSPAVGSSDGSGLPEERGGGFSSDGWW